MMHRSLPHNAIEFINSALPYEVVRIGSSGLSSSCFYFSVARSLIPTYQNPQLLKDYLKSNNNYESNQNIFIKQLRNDIKNWCLEISSSLSDNEIIRNINNNPNILKLIILGSTRSIYSIKCSQINRMYPRVYIEDETKPGTRMNIRFGMFVTEIITFGTEEEKKILMQDISKNYIWNDHYDVRKEISKSIEESKDPYTPDNLQKYLQVASRTSIITLENFNKRVIRFKGKDIFFPDLKAALSDLYDICMTFNFETDRNLRAFNAYKYQIDTNSSIKDPEDNTMFMSINSLLLKTALFKKDSLGNIVDECPEFLSVCKAVRNYVELRITLANYITQSIVDPKNITFGKHLVKDIPDLLTSDEGWERIQSSINPKTQQFFTQREIEELKNKDPRDHSDPDSDATLVNDIHARKERISINFFTAGNGKFIENYRSRRPEYHLHRIIQSIESADAGEDDVIPLIPFVFNGIDIYLCKLSGNNIVLINIYTQEDLEYNNPGIIIHRLGDINSGHFETIGISENNSIKTLFESNHPLLILLRKMK